MAGTFFDESTEQSQIKARIIAKYFWAWANVMIPTIKKRENRLAYIDLFAGPGRYKDGTMSTPLLVLKQAIADPGMREMLVTLFNDRNATSAKTLEQEIEALPGIASLKFHPVVKHEEVGDQIVKLFAEMKLVPTFFFVDPWGYKGLSLQLINSVLRNWGCDCVFFFNYNRINMGLTNPAVQEHMEALFGSERTAQVREALRGLAPEEREVFIVEALSRALKEMGGSFVLPFAFKNAEGSRTTHHLIFVSKHFKGYEIMKEIMAAESSDRTQGVPSFEYSAAIEKYPLLFELTKPLNDLEEMLLDAFAGQTLTTQEIYQQHSVGRPYLKANYKSVLRHLEAAGRVSANPEAAARQKRKGEVTFADSEGHFPG